MKATLIILYTIYPGATNTIYSRRSTTDFDPNKKYLKIIFTSINKCFTYLV